MHKEDAKECFEEFGTKRCKVENMVLSEDLKLYDILDWPPGFCMSVYKTGDKK
ncbi:MAG TPA: hypothetical protein VMV43_05935 [Candidatus Nanopelagicaceae bacterium]|nr:hypothetical protein [Candidatus Nanopelagicaceae bacterium]